MTLTSTQIARQWLAARATAKPIHTWAPLVTFDGKRARHAWELTRFPAVGPPIVATRTACGINGTAPTDFVDTSATPDCEACLDVAAQPLARLIEEVREGGAWEDTKDEWSSEISAAFPTRSGSHDEYGVAMQMVGHRHGKHELVALVNWLLVRIRNLSNKSNEAQRGGSMTVWQIARANGRDFITPDDVASAAARGASQTDLWLAVLQAIEADAAQDTGACAALKGFGFKVRRRVKGGAYEEM